MPESTLEERPQEGLLPWRGKVGFGGGGGTPESVGGAEDDGRDFAVFAQLDSRCIFASNLIAG